jgi:N-acyl-D-amino-acid deacylase
MDEENIKKQQQLPWVSFGSDEGSYTPEGEKMGNTPAPNPAGL